MGKRRVMCVSDMQGEECHANERANCCYCLLTKRSCVLEKQTIQTSTAIMNDLTRIGDYELLEKENEGYEQESTQLGVECGLTSLKNATELQMRLY